MDNAELLFNQITLRLTISNIFFNSVPVSRQEGVHYLGDHKKMNTDLVGEKWDH